MYPLKNLPPYDPNNLEKTGLVYTTVYLGNYISGDYSEGGGSHPGVDMIPKVKNDAIYCPLPGIVIEAKENASEGKFVVIKHENITDTATGKTATYVSNFLHLSEYSVSKGDILNEGDVIGKTGSTGQSTGEHLHFQIDTGDAPFHPYWPFTYLEAQQLGLGFFEAVNRGLGIEKAEKYTVNPLVFLSTAVAKNTATPSVTTPTAPVLSREEEKPTVSASGEEKEKSIAASSSSSFQDVPLTHPYYEAISYVQKAGIAQGINGKFSPDAPVTRAEILKMGFNASGKTLSIDTKSYFKDVPSNHPLIAYINTARELKVASGHANGTFLPNNPVSRIEGLKMLLNLFQIQLETVDGPVYADVGLNDWSAPYVLWSRENEVLQAKGINFLPNAQLSRAEVANILYTLR